MANIMQKSIKYPGLSNTYTFVQLDDTLGVSGKAADSKAAGDAIAAVSAKVNPYVSPDGAVLKSILVPDFTEQTVQNRVYSKTGNQVCIKLGSSANSQGCIISLTGDAQRSAQATPGVYSPNAGNLVAIAKFKPIIVSIANKPTASAYTANVAVRFYTVSGSTVTFIDSALVALDSAVDNLVLLNSVIPAAATHFEIILYTRQGQGFPTDSYTVISFDTVADGLVAGKRGIINKTASLIKIYIPASDGKRYIEYGISKINNSDINAQLWRTFQCFVCNNDLSRITALSSNTEWDMAIKLASRPDFIGGGTHGSEQMTDFALYIDGISVAQDAVITRAFNTLTLVQSISMYDPADETTVVGEHRKELTFDARTNKATISNWIKWAGSYTVETGYLFMAPILRVYENVQITDSAIDDGDYLLTDVSTTTFDPANADGGVGASKTGVSRYDLWGQTLGVHVSAQVLKRGLNTGESFVSNDASYNKIYCAYAAANASVSEGDIWQQVTEYSIDADAAAPERA